MSLPLIPIMQEVIAETSAIELDRRNHDEPVEYPGIKDGMLHLHTAWQDLMKATRAQKDLPDTAIAPAIRLAAAAMKFASDLGTPEAFKTIQTNEVHRRAVMLEKSKKYGNRLAVFLGVKAG